MFCILQVARKWVFKAGSRASHAEFLVDSAALYDLFDFVLSCTPQWYTD